MFVPLALIALLIIVIVGAPILVSPERLRAAAVELLADGLGVDVAIGKLDYHPLFGLRLEDVRFGPPPGYTADVAAIGSIDLDYDLVGRGLAIRSLIIERPKFTIESRDGVTNLDALLAKLAPKDPAAPAPTPSAPPDRTKPFTPVSIAVDQVRIQDAAFHMVGDGRDVSVEGVDLGLRARIDQRRLSALLTVGERQGRVKVSLQPRDGGPPFDLAAELDLALTASVSGATDRGLTIETVGLALRAGVERMIVRTERALAPIDAALQIDVDLRPASGTVATSFDVEFNKASIVQARAELAGLAVAMRPVLGDAAVKQLGLQVGLSLAGGDGVARLFVEHIRVPLQVVEPYVDPVLPGVRLRGAVAVAPLRLSATVAELLESNPRLLQAKLRFEDVAVAVPTMLARIRRVRGDIDVTTSSATPTLIEGTVSVSDVAFGPQRVQGLALGIEGELERLTYPSTGMTAMAVNVGLTGIETPQATIEQVSLSAGFRGDDALSGARTQMEAVTVSAAVQAPTMVIRSGTTSIDIAGLDVRLSAEADRLLAPSTKPVHIEMRTKIANVQLAPMRALNTALTLDVTTTDPRDGSPMSTGVQADLRIGRVERPEATLERVSARAAVQAEGIAALVVGSTSPLPETVTTSIAIRLPAIAIDHPATGPHDTSAKLDFRANARPLAQTASIERLRLSIDDVIDVGVTSKLRNYLTDEITTDTRVVLSPIDLAKLFQRLPPAITGLIPGASATGSLGARLHAKGKLPLAGPPAKGRRIPLDLEAGLVMNQIGVSVPSEYVTIEGFDGRVSGELFRGREWVRGALTVGKLIREAPDAPVSARNVKLRLGGGLEGDTWSIDTELTADELAAGSAVGVARAAFVQAVLSYPQYGDLDIERLVVRVPDSGVDATVRGRLTRRRYGAFRPALDIDAYIDFDRLRVLLPDVSSGSGRLHAQVGLTSPTEALLDVRGAVGFDGFSWTTPEFVLSNAVGRVPFEQRLSIAAARPLDESAASEVPGHLGDDFEVRLAQMVEALQSSWRLVVDGSNILVEAPAAADYEAMRPYYKGDGARLRIDSIDVAGTRLSALSADALYRSGVIRMDRLAVQVYEGDIFGDMSLQLASERDIRARMRVTATDLNLDVPTAAKVGKPRASAGARPLFLLSGVSDIKLDLGEQTINGKLDLTKMGGQLVIRILDVLDPEGKDSGLQSTRAGLSGVLGGFFGERLAGVRVWIRENLLNQSFIWDRPWFRYIDIFGDEEEETPHVLLPAVRGIQELLSFVSGGRIQFSIVDAVPEIRRRNLAEVWASPVWSDLASRLEPLHRRIVSADELAASSAAEVASQ